MGIGGQLLTWQVPFRAMLDAYCISKRMLAAYDGAVKGGVIFLRMFHKYMGALDVDETSSTFTLGTQSISIFEILHIQCIYIHRCILCVCKYVYMHTHIHTYIRTCIAMCAG